MLGLDTVEEREVIHHIDTVFGILLTIVVFQSNLVLSFVKEIITPWPDVDTILLALLVTTAVSVWVVAVLRQSWLWKLTAWSMAFFLLLWEASMLVYTLTAIQTGVRMVRVPSPFILGVLMMASFFLSKRLVVDAYWRRLYAVAPKGVLIRALASYKAPTRRTVWLLMIVSCIILFFASIRP